MVDASSDETVQPEGVATAGRMAEAAGAWLASLDAGQRAVATGAAPSAADREGDAERLRWFYTPVDHGGLTFHAQRPAQQQLAMRLVATGLSEAGFTTVATVIGLENVLDRAEGFRPSHGRERGRDPGLYYLRVFGTPGGTAPWGWRFGGHHVSLNNLVVDGRVAATTPNFLGANPARSPLLGGTELRPLAGPEELARELVRSLPRELAARAVLLPRAPSDILTGNRSRVADETAPADDDAVALTPTPKGVAAADLDTAQREMVFALLATYLDRVPAAVSPLARYADPAELDAVHVAWAGSLEPGAPHYYRLHGPRLLAEWDNTQNDANHAHAVWRDPEADFGLDVLAAHRAAHHS
ncbi:DUF3500 domain-containing protein [Pseudonocardia nigra]|uniref:DUF3500 domain-containing protein n=1 Tax=Pseudonocardia nigra TaxID=1921578 RepID=UPI001C5EF6BD|nr:DUF3500 domain-containing protein [Pseudonocardia nigra]